MKKYDLHDRIEIMLTLFPEVETDERVKQAAALFEKYSREQPELVAMLKADEQEHENKATSFAAKSVPDWLGVLIAGKAYPVFSMLQYADNSVDHFAVKEGRYVCAEDQAGFTGVIDLRAYHRPLQPSAAVVVMA